MQPARFHTVCPTLFPKLGPHSVSAVQPSLLWHAARHRLAASLLRIAGMTALALSIHCAGAKAEPLRSPPAIVSDRYADFIAEASQRFGVPASWLSAVMQVESAGNPKAVSPKGAMGLMQLMPDTWSALGSRRALRRGNCIARLAALGLTKSIFAHGRKSYGPPKVPGGPGRAGRDAARPEWRGDEYAKAERPCADAHGG
jgi:hypothetical protein